VFERPATEFVANFMGASNFFSGRVKEVRADGLMVELGGGGEACIPAEEAGLAPAPGTEVRFVVRPEKLDLRPRDLSRHGVPSLAVIVEERVYQGVSTVWVVRDSAGARYVVYEQNEKPFEQVSRFEAGSRAFVCWSPRHAVLIRGEEISR
jgi:putative spermidine/putrescine transport system ATP-binding protein/spermidine/putrescine transport system ATP-binding protein